MTKEIQDSTQLMRHGLASVDLSDIKEELLPPEKQKRSEDAELFYLNYFSDFLKTLMQGQLEFIAKKAISMEQFMFGKGTFNGISIINDWFEDQCKLSGTRFDKEPEPIPGQAIETI